MLVSNFINLVYRNILPTGLKKRIEFYKKVEEKLFCEEFEDSKKEFKIDETDVQQIKLKKDLHKQKILGIHKNRLKLYRSDSMDEILEKIDTRG